MQVNRMDTGKCLLVIRKLFCNYWVIGIQESFLGHIKIYYYYIIIIEALSMVKIIWF